MDIETNDKPQPRRLASNQPVATPSLVPRPSPTSTPALRFPRPQGSQKLANWISNSSPDILQPFMMTEPDHLADSAYEIINGTDDNESQGSRMSESTGSLDASRPEDVHSLDGSESHYDTETDEESDHSSQASSIRYADQVLQSPSTHIPTNSSLRYSSPSSSQGSGVILDSIEFREEDVGKSNISVNHVIREYMDVESAAVAKGQNFPVSPVRLVSMVRQTMSPTYLSTKKPFRLVYVGRSDAKRTIVIKISSAIWASPNTSTSDESTFTRHRDGVYNIVPISSFGPTPELDLMESSQYQIKVEHCTSALEHTVVGSSVYSVTIGDENEKTYSAVTTPDGRLSMQQEWALPHVAIFYYPDDEDEHEKQTREAAFKFMKGHNVPCIFISQSDRLWKSTKESWGQYVDEHAAHICLESRDPENPLPPQRFPIDLNSFTNIDSRQMNRNLAYLTGLSETSEKKAKSCTSCRGRWAKLRKAWSRTPSVEEIAKSIDQNRWFMALTIPIFMALLAPLIFSIFAASPSGGGSPVIQQVPSPGSLSLSSATCIGRLSTTSKALPTSTSTSTVVINVTSTKTVQIARVLPSTSNVASALSFAGFLSDRPSDTPVEPETKKPVFVRLHSPNEILVAIDSIRKSVWLGKGAIDIDVRRGQETLKTKLSSVDEGVLVELAPKDAHGVVNVSVITTRRRKINETFEVDFGTDLMVEVIEAGKHLLQGFAKLVHSTVEEAVGVVEGAQLPDVTKLRTEAASAWDQAMGMSKRQYEEALNRVKHSFGPNYEQAKEVVSRHMKSAKRMREDADISILQAQIASRLWWLKVQGKMDEFAEYKRNASLLLKRKFAERQDTQAKAACARFPKHMLSQCRKAHQGGDSKESGWKKMILG